MTVNRSVLVEGLHLFVLVGFAIAQPLYDILSQNPEFFLSHKASPALIVVVVFVISFGLPLFLIALELIAWMVGEPVRRSVHWIFVFLLAMVTVMPIVKQMALGPDVIPIGMAGFFATVFVALYARFQPIHVFLNWLTPAVLIFPLWFLFLTPIRSLLIQQNITAHHDLEVKNPIPVVVVVLDEFGITALMDAAGQIDGKRFPNFAEFAEESWWFPNAMAAAQSTEAALPAIVSGQPPSSLFTFPAPTANNYPRTIFTMLGGRYHLNVFESMTALCPEALCRPEASGIGGRGMWVFLDLVVIYGHLISPPDMSQKLPSLGVQWAGFGKNLILQSVSKWVKGGSPHKRPIHFSERDLLLEEFLARIEKSPKTSLHFLHVMLPHAPYEFLASGHQYLPSDGAAPAGIRGVPNRWGGEEPLILTAYHRYLEQIGYVDRFLGQLRRSLETTHIFDDAVIILTADHGVSFRPGKLRRKIEKENAGDILRIPMIVKLPGQREGKISQRLVSSVDILPTLIDVLNINNSWDLAGKSMVADEELARTSIEITGLGHFSKDDLIGFSRLKWQTDHFQVNSSLDDLVPPGPNPWLIGQAVSTLSIGEPGTMRVLYPDRLHFQHVNPESGFIPALLRAEILETNNQNLPIAVTLNGRIWSTTRSVKWNGKANYLSVLLPLKAFKRGRNIPKVYLIDEIGKTLSPIPSTDGQQHVMLQREASGQFTLLFVDGTKIPVEAGPKTLRGSLDNVHSLKNLLVLEGWAADIGAPQPAATLLIFSEEQLVAQINPKHSRPDVVKAFQQEGMLLSGFRIEIPLGVLTSRGGEVRVIVLSQGQRAFQLQFTDEQKRYLRTILSKNTREKAFQTIFEGDRKGIEKEGDITSNR